jgi:hypothetical protein
VRSPPALTSHQADVNVLSNVLANVTASFTKLVEAHAVVLASASLSVNRSLVLG